MADYSYKITLLQNRTNFEEFAEIEDDHPWETIAAHHEEQRRIVTIMDKLSDRQRELIQLRYLEEKCIDEIAALTSLTPRTIYNTLHNALTRLREAMG